MGSHSDSPAPHAAIRTRPRPACPVCGGSGEIRFRESIDRLFGVPGQWTLRSCADAACSSFWLDPAPLPEDLGLLYRRYYTHRGPERPGPARTLYWQGVRGLLARRYGYPSPGPLGEALGVLLSTFENRVDQIGHSISHLPFLPSGRVLDVGCGDGARLDRLRSLGWQCTGVDLDTAALASGRGRGLDLRLGTAETLEEPDASFDAITLSHVIEHVPDPRVTLRSCRRMLRSGGLLSVATPNALSLGAQRWKAEWRGWEVPRHLQVFSPRSLARIVESAGFRLTTCRTSARIAATILLESEEPEQVNQNLPHTPKAIHRAAEFERIERAALRTDPLVGEELVLLATT